MTAALLLRASDLPGVLDGWVGPALSADGVTPVVLLGREPEDGSRFAWWPMLWRGGSIPEDWIRLDLSRAECRDRVARVVAGRVGLECGATAPLWYPDWPEGTWTLDPDYNRTDERLFSAQPVHPGAGRGARRSSVPALATLDPADDRCLPDGSRWVDAAALKLVAEHVGARVSP